MKNFILLLIFLLLHQSCVFAEGELFSNYDDKGRRDPFFALVDKDGRYISDAEYSGGLKLSGILWDPQGQSSALINTQVLRIGESINGFVIKKITKNSVTISKEGKNYILRLFVQEGE
jgi:type II secretory pathway component PulC